MHVEHALPFPTVRPGAAWCARSAKENQSPDQFLEIARHVHKGLAGLEQGKVCTRLYSNLVQ